MRQLRGIVVTFLVVISATLLTVQTIEASERNSNIFPQAIGMRGRVTANNVNIRTEPSLYGKVAGKLSNENIMVTGKYKDWYRIKYNKEDLWMSRRYVAVQESHLIPEVSLLGEQIVEYGKQFIGTPYVWGGTNLTKGVDCSGFTQGIYKRFDIELNRTSYMQALNGKTIPKEQLRSGDLIFFDTNGINRGKISHVGVYVGDGEFIHSDMTKGISIAKLDNSYYRRNYVKSVRVVGI